MSSSVTSNTTTTTMNNMSIQFRAVRPTDMDQCYALERDSYPDDEAASKTTLQFRQHHAARYFRCAVLVPEDELEDDEVEGDATTTTETARTSNHISGRNSKADAVIPSDADQDSIIVGYICSTLCRQFDLESMQNHVPSGPLLAIHSVVVDRKYRRRHIATKMLLDYIHFIQDSNAERVTPIEKFVLLAKANLLTFYINCGFSVIGKSSIVHGRETWYHLERALPKLPSLCDQGLACHVVNAFCEPTASSSSGNPAAVVIVPDGTDMASHEQLAWMQMVAAQFNLSETAFVLQRNGTSSSHDDSHSHSVLEPSTTSTVDDQDDDDDDAAHYTIRYFTPRMQIALCGHATLAAAAVLYQTMLTTSRCPIYFHASGSLMLKAEYAAPASGSCRDCRIKMKFPVMPALEIEDEDARRDITKMLTVALDLADNDSECIVYIGFTDQGDVLVELTYESFIQIASDDGAAIDYAGFLLYDGYTRGVIVCCHAPPQREDDDDDEADGAVDVRTVDFYSRFFAPKAGIPEDPVTGSAHATLAPYFGKKLDKQRLKGMQMSRRGGMVECQLLPEEAAVELTGLAVTVMTGELFM